MSNATAPQNMLFCHGLGKLHSPNSKTNPKALLTIGWGGIVEMANNPGSVTKQDGPWVIPSSLLSRTFHEQEADGSFGLLWFDFDENPPLLSGIQNVIGKWSQTPFNYVFYHTRSATADRQKCRLLILLAEPVIASVWLVLQHIGNQKFRDYGIIPDPKNEGAGQLCYLPNKGDFYQPHVEEGRGGFDPFLWQDEIDARYEADQIQTDQDTQSKRERDRQREFKRAAGLEMSNDRNPITLFNELYSVEDVLLMNGYDQRGSHFRHPKSETGNFSASVKDGRVFTLSSADPLFIPEGTKGRAHDSFGAFTVLNHSGDEKAALKDAADKWIMIGNESLNKAKRREWQQEQSRRFGEEGFSDSEQKIQVDQLTLNKALTRFVLLEDGSRVADLLRPRWSVALSDFKNVYAGSKEKIDGNDVAVTRLWLSHPNRITRYGQTFRAGAGRYTQDPEGRQCLNTWSPIERFGPIGDPEQFISHTNYLFKDRADDVLDWFAHIEQKPGELPQTAWVHIGPCTGLGRNWLSSVLARLWAGQVATNYDLTGTLDSRFNGRLAGKILAQVDEIREGGGSQRWRHQESLKRIINEEIREIKPKYGREYVEWNACRWLIFSNSESAIPLESNDRRFEVVICRELPKPQEEYKALYKLLNDISFINGVADFLNKRDLSSFEYGRRASNTADKSLLREASMSEYEHLAQDVVSGWPADVITNPILTRIFNGESSLREIDKGLPAPAGHALREAGARSGGGKVRVGMPQRYWILRNHHKWESAGPEYLRLEIMKCNPPEHISAKSYLRG